MNTWCAQVVILPLGEPFYDRIAELAELMHVQMATAPRGRLIVSTWRSDPRWVN